jgi:hypothetical protein
LAMAPASNVRPSARADGTPPVVATAAHSMRTAAHARALSIHARAATRRHTAAGVGTMLLWQMTRKQDHTNHTNHTVNFSNTAVTIVHRRQGAWIAAFNG